MYHVTTFDLEGRITVGRTSDGATFVCVRGKDCSVSLICDSVEKIDKLRAALMVARDALEANEDAA